MTTQTHEDVRKRIEDIRCAMLTTREPVQLFRMAKAAVTGKRPLDLGGHRTVTMQPEAGTRSRIAA